MFFFHGSPNIRAYISKAETSWTCSLSRDENVSFGIAAESSTWFRRRPSRPWNSQRWRCRFLRTSGYLMNPLLMTSIPYDAKLGASSFHHLRRWCRISRTRILLAVPNLRLGSNAKPWCSVFEWHFKARAIGGPGYLYAHVRLRFNNCVVGKI